jgi:hypothetical protein
MRERHAPQRAISAVKQKGKWRDVRTLLSIAAPAWAQATAQMSGRITDESGAVLPGLTVTATQTDTGSTAMLSLISQETR